MAKTVGISVRPSRARPAAEAWVSSDASSREALAKVKRLTVDLDPELHGRFKAHCALHQTKMVTEVVAMIRRFLDPSL